MVREDLRCFTKLHRSSAAPGHVRAWVDTESNFIYWKLRYDGLESTVTRTQVYCGQRGVGPGGTQACRAGSAASGGAVRSDLVLGPGASGRVGEIRGQLR